MTKVYAGIDIGGMTVKVAIVGEDGKILAKEAFDTIPGEMNKTVDDMLLTINKLENKLNVKVSGIGVDVPGTCDSENGVVISAVNLKWFNYNLKKDLEKRVDVKVNVLNDANAAAFGEYKFSDANKYSSVCMITLGTGVGSGIILDGKIFAGYKYAGGEIGHIPIVVGGEKCACGGKGCLERYASASAIINQTKKAIAKNPFSILAQVAEREGEVNGKTAFIAEREGCPIAKRVINKYIAYIVYGLIAITNIIHPECIIIGGGISREGESFISRIRKKLYAYQRKSGFTPYVELRAATLFNDAGMIGSAATLIEE